MIAMISAALASGALVGFSLGLVGGGGSILATPLLLYVVGVAQPHIAIGTGALAVSVNAFANITGHARAGNVRWRCAVIFAVVGTLGALAGSSLGKLVDGNRLLFLFGLVMVAVGAMMLRPRRENAAAERKANLATCLLTAAVAFLAGMASGFFGIGGGFLIVPSLMLATRMPMIKEVGSSLLAVGSSGSPRRSTTRCPVWSIGGSPASSSPAASWRARRHDAGQSTVARQRHAEAHLRGLDLRRGCLRPLSQRTNDDELGRIRRGMRGNHSPCFWRQPR